jgi:hypothetical protein
MIKQTVAVVVAKTIFSVALIVAVLSIALVQTQTVKAQDGSSAGAQAARADFRNDRDTPHGSCEEHGVDVTQYPGWCLGFKASYAIQWAILKLGQ